MENDVKKKKEELVKKMKEEPGIAHIKHEYLDVCHEKRAALDHLPKEVAEEVMQVAVTKCDNNGPPIKKVKLKGRNKGRPIEKRPACDVKLCSSITRGKICNYGEKCKFLHDVAFFMASKPKDISDYCYIFDKYGFCPFGVTCRFGNKHINSEFQNVINEELFVAVQDQQKVQNLLSKNIQHQLWKKTYNFSLAQKVLKSVQKNSSKLKDSKEDCSNEGENDVDLLESENLSNTNMPCVDNNAFFADSDMQAVNMSPSYKYEKELTPGENFQTDGNESNKFDVHIETAIIETLPVEILRDDSLNEALNTSKHETEKRIGLTSDEDLVKLKRAEKKKVDLNGKLYLSPLTTVGNLPFRRICKQLGAEVTCSEMAVTSNLLKGQQSEWALLKRHSSEDIFGIQICGGYPDTMIRCAQLLNDNVDFDYLDINCGCPIDLIFNKGEGCGLMGRLSRLEPIICGIDQVISTPLTVKIRTGIYEGKYTAHSLVPKLRDWGVSMTAIHGRTRQQRYTRTADWNYIAECAKVAAPMPIFGNGDVLSFEDYNTHMSNSGVAGILIARGALIKPWIFTEIREQRHWDISASERFDILKNFVNYGLENWGSDDQGVSTTRRFLLEWLSFLYRYIPVGILERIPQKINEKPVAYFGRNDLETLFASPNCADWIKISEMLLGPVSSGFTFAPKHRANAYQ